MPKLRGLATSASWRIAVSSEVGFPAVTCSSNRGCPCCYSLRFRPPISLRSSVTSFTMSTRGPRKCLITASTLYRRLAKPPSCPDYDKPSSVVSRSSLNLSRGKAQPPCRSGFTLVELLVVIAIIGILIALLLGRQFSPLVLLHATCNAKTSSSRYRSPS